MKMKVTYAIVIAILVFGAYVLVVQGGKIKFGNLIEVESNKSQPPAAAINDQESPSGYSQSSNVNGSGTAVNANNGASVRIGQ